MSEIFSRFIHSLALHFVIQTWLAVYFCFVDCTLLGQFIYYRSISPSSKQQFAPPFQARSRAGSIVDQHRTDRNTAHYRAISAAAAHVAASAAVAAHRDEHVRYVKHSPEARRSVEAPEYDEDEDEVSDEALARLTESFHSERGHSKRVSWGQDHFSGRGSSLGRHRQTTLSPTLRMTPQADQSDPLAERGRPLERGSAPDEDHDEGQRTTSSHTPRRNSRASRKRASMVFLGVWALFGIGTLTSGQHGFIPTTRYAGQVGRVLTRPDIGEFNTTERFAIIPSELKSNYVTSYPSLHIREITSSFDVNKPPEQPSMEFIIGRVSAWICTTLYLTSRLPQIWKNVRAASLFNSSAYLRFTVC